MHGYNGAGGRIGATKIPEEYRNVTLKTVSPRQDQPAAYAIFDQYAKTFTRQFEPEGERIKSLYLYSLEPGTGKTTSAITLLHEYIIVNYVGSLRRDRQPPQTPAYFLDVNAWQELYTEFTRPNVPEDIAEPASREYYRQMTSAKSSPFVVLDDIGVRTASEGFRGDLHSIVNYRTTNGLTTIYTSNVSIEGLSQGFDRRLADRVRDMCAVVPFVGESKRGIR
ncbi:DNA replication protein [Paenibacillus terrigena]|uniref:DNA replication protein n=1 Tax=Paenibacillus terrigena TaxID=369333 RepID=UPI001FE09692|nr:DNA replication protein [Paenibacillus terrigena]